MIHFTRNLNCIMKLLITWEMFFGTKTGLLFTAVHCSRPVLSSKMAFLRLLRVIVISVAYVRVRLICAQDCENGVK